MKFRSIFPLVEFSDEFTFEACNTNEDFLIEIVRIHFSNTDLRLKEGTLAVYIAYRDHYPKYLHCLSIEAQAQLNSDFDVASGKVIKLRRIALSALSKVA